MKVRGSGINSEHRFEWFEVRLLKVREVRGSEISGSFQVYSKFAIFIEKENPCSFFCFSFRVTLSFAL